jgi:hypothetical protein
MRVDIRTGLRTGLGEESAEALIRLGRLAFFGEVSIGLRESILARTSAMDVGHMEIHT